MTQILRMINGIDNKHHDYDYTQTILYLAKYIGGIAYLNPAIKTEFDFDVAGAKIKAGSAFIVCTRTSSTPIANQKFLSVFYSDGDVSVVVGPNRKYYIEVNPTLINDSTLIDDPDGSTDYLMGKNLAQITSSTARPAHSNYIKLWSTDGSSNRVDERKQFLIDGTNTDLTNYTGIIGANTINAGTIYVTNMSAVGTVNLPSGTTFGGLNLTQILQINMATQIMNALSKYISFGDGSDGDVTLGAGTTTLSRDMYYNNLTVPSGATLNPNGYRVFVRYNFTGTGSIVRNGNNGQTGIAGGVTGYNSVTVGGAALNQGSLNAELGGSNGGAGVASGATGGVGTAGTTANPTLSSANGSSGGYGGGFNGSNATAGAGGSSTRAENYNKVYDYKIMHMATANGYTAQNSKSSGSAGGGGGGGSNGGASAGGSGGAGGGNGGMIWIACYDWNFTGTIQAKGGNGGNGGNSLNQASGGGGGGGGNGGCVLRIYTVLTNDANFDLAGGTGGTGGAIATPISGGATGFERAGQNGTAGSIGQLVSICTGP